MPQVPYSPVPSVAPSNQAIGNVEISTPIAAFGGTVAGAIGSVGQAAEHVGGELVTRAIALQNLQNETMAKEEDARFTQRAGELHAQYNSLQGKDAVSAYPRYLRDLQLLRQEHRKALPNDTARRMYDPGSLSVMNRSIFNGAGHAATEQRRWSIGESDARSQTASNFAAQNPEDPRATEEAEQIIRDEAQDSSHLRGEGNEATALRESNGVSALYRDRIKNLSRTNALGARQLFEVNRSRMRAQDIDQAEAFVQRNFNQQVSRQISEMVNPLPQEGVEGEPLRERLERARARAEELAPGDSQFATVTAERVRIDYDHQRSVLRNDQQNRDNVIIGAINNNNPTTVEELIAVSPEVSGAWDNTPEVRRRSVMNMLAANARGDNRFTQEGLRRYQELRGLAQENPTQFLDVDVLAEPGMTNQARNALSALQLRIRGNPEQDPRIGRAMTQLGPMLDSAGITNDSASRTRRLQFRGALSDALQEFQRENNRFPRPDEISQIGSRLLQPETSPGYGVVESMPRWLRNNLPDFITGRESTPLYERTVPEAVREQFENDPRWQGRAPTNAERELFRRRYIREQYQQLYGGTKKKQP